MEYPHQLRRELRRHRGDLAQLAARVATVSPEAAKEVERARSALFAAWAMMLAEGG